MNFELFWKNPGYVVRPELKEDISCDYLIVGGGVTGVSTAYFLAKAGAKNIVLIEKTHIASGATGRAAGSLVIRGESDLSDIIKEHGPENGAAYWKLIHEGLQGIKDVIRDENIDCDAEPQDSLYCDDKQKKSDLDEEYLAEKNLEPTTQFLEGEALKKELNTPYYTHGILSAGHGLSVNPLKLTQNLSKAVEKYGVKIYENTALLNIGDHVVKTHRGDIRFKKLILAIDADHPSGEVINMKSTILITRPLTSNELVETGLNKKKIVFDSKKNYHYFKLTKDNRILFGFGGVKVHKINKKHDPHHPHLQTMQKYMKKVFPSLELEPEYVWSGSFGVSKDYRTRGFNPFIERKDDVVAIAGAATQVVCFVAAKQITNLLLGKDHVLDSYFY